MGDSGKSIGNDKNMEIIEGKHLPANPGREPRLRLGSIREVRRELVKVYAMAKSGKIATQDASRLVFMLQALAGMIKDDELESRILALEKAQNEKFGSKNYPT